MAVTEPKRGGEARRTFEAGEQDVQNPRDQTGCALLIECG